MVDSVLQLQHDLPDAQRLHTCHGGFVRPEHTAGEDFTQAAAEFQSGRIHRIFLSVLQVDIDEMVERRITEITPFSQQVGIERPVIILHHLPDNRQVRTFRL